MLLGLLGVWNSSFLKYSSRALLPYAQALVRFAAHIQQVSAVLWRFHLLVLQLTYILATFQVDMESNGKRITVDGT